VDRGLADGERAFVHVDYEGYHSVFEEHNPLYESEEKKTPLFVRVKEKIFKDKERRGKRLRRKLAFSAPDEL
jgi:hypothetical protein